MDDFRYQKARIAVRKRGYSKYISSGDTEMVWDMISFGADFSGLEQRGELTFSYLCQAIMEKNGALLMRY